MQEEIGEYKSDFSQIVIDTCAPSKYDLIDNWTFELEQHHRLDENKEYASKSRAKIHWDHYDDDADDPQEQNFEYVTRRVASKPSGRVIRAESTNRCA